MNFPKKIIYHCLECNKEFKRSPGYMKKKGGGKFCSRKCRGSWSTKNNIGTIQTFVQLIQEASQ